LALLGGKSIFASTREDCSSIPARIEVFTGGGINGVRSDVPASNDIDSASEFDRHSDSQRITRGRSEPNKVDSSSDFTTTTTKHTLSCEGVQVACVGNGWDDVRSTQLSISSITRGTGACEGSRTCGGTNTTRSRGTDIGITTEVDRRTRVISASSFITRITDTSSSTKLRGDALSIGITGEFVVISERATFVDIFSILGTLQSNCKTIVESDTSGATLIDGTFSMNLARESLLLPVVRLTTATSIKDNSSHRPSRRTQTTNTGKVGRVDCVATKTSIDPFPDSVGKSRFRSAFGN